MVFRSVSHRSGIRIAAVAAATAGAIALAGCSTGATASSSKSDSSGHVKMTIGLSQPFMTNAWQQALVKSAQWSVKQLNSKGDDITLKVVDANGNSQTQIQQINDLVLSGVDVLLVDPSSSSALNGAINQAVAAGIPTIDFADGPVTTSKPYELEFNVAKEQERIAKTLFQEMGGKGNVLNIRGAEGSGADPLWQKGVDEALKSYPGIKIVSQVYGEWDESTTQSRVASVISTLPQIDGILTQGQEGYGAAQAFITANRPVPLQVWGTPGVEINFWRQLAAKGNYDTVASSADAGIGSIAVNVALAVKQGKKIPTSMTAPFLTITPKELNTTFAKLGDNDSAYANYSYAWTEKNILKQ
jgi:ribose transport system substrate-binding protein